MTIDTKTVDSNPETDRNSFRAVRLADEDTDLERMDGNKLTDDEKIDLVARRILEEYRPAFEELAKG